MNPEATTGAHWEAARQGLKRAHVEAIAAAEQTRLLLVELENYGESDALWERVKLYVREIEENG